MSTSPVLSGAGVRRADRPPGTPTGHRAWSAGPSHRTAGAALPLPTAGQGSGRSGTGALRRRARAEVAPLRPQLKVGHEHEHHAAQHRADHRHLRMPARRRLLRLTSLHTTRRPGAGRDHRKHLEPVRPQPINSARAQGFQSLALQDSANSRASRRPVRKRPVGGSRRWARWPRQHDEAPGGCRGLRSTNRVQSTHQETGREVGPRTTASGGR